MINRIKNVYNMEQTRPISTGNALRDIPVASPYYDRLRSLNCELDFVPFGSPEYRYLCEQIEEMEHRARKHMLAARHLEEMM